MSRIFVIYLMLAASSQANASWTELCIYKGKVSKVSEFSTTERLGSNHVFDLNVVAAMKLWGSHQDCSERIGKDISIVLERSEKGSAFSVGQEVVVQYQRYQEMCPTPEGGACTYYQHHIISTEHWH